MSEVYRVGLGVRASALYDRGPGRIGIRAGLRAEWFEGREADMVGNVRADAQSVGLSVDAVFRGRIGRALLYSAAGGGAYHQRAGRHDPYGFVPGVQAGVGLAVPIGGVHVTSEVQVLAVLSDLLASEYRPSVRVPISVGVTF